MKPIQGRTLLSCIAVFAALSPAAALAQAFPSQPIQLVVPWPPGGGSDTAMRMTADAATKKMGVPVVVVNKPGAGGTVGIKEVMSSKPDGYTLAMIATGAIFAAYNNPNANSLDEMEPIVFFGDDPSAITVNPKTGFKNLAELVAFAKANPGKLNFGSAGSGTTHHLAGELFKTMTGLNLVHVPYKGAGPMMQDLIAGQVDMAFDGMGTSAPQIKGGKLKAIAVTTEKRSFVAPNVPTMQEAGLPGYEVTTWYALWAVKGTPKEALDRMYQETVKALQSPELKTVWEAQGATAGGESPEKFAALVNAEITKWAKVVKDSGAKIDN